MKKKTFVLLTIIASIFLFFGNNVNSTSAALEIEYPSLVLFPTVKPPQEFVLTADSEEILGLYVLYIYHLALSLSAFIIFVSLVIGGVKYVFATGNAGRMSNARSQISSGATGIALLFGSYMILNIINPQLLILETHRPDAEITPAPTSPPITSENPTYFQVPVGKIIENLLLSDEAKERLEEIKRLTKEAKDFSEDIKNSSEKIKELTSKCQCGLVNCTGPDACSGISCPDAGRECDLAAIQREKDKMGVNIDELETRKDEIVEKIDEFINELQQIKKAYLLVSMSPAIDYNSMLYIKWFDEVEITTFSPENDYSNCFSDWKNIDWENIDTKIEDKIVADPVTFYLEEESNQEIIDTACIGEIILAPPSEQYVTQPEREEPEEPKLTCGKEIPSGEALTKTLAFVLELEEALNAIKTAIIDQVSATEQLILLAGQCDPTRCRPINCGSYQEQLSNALCSNNPLNPNDCTNATEPPCAPEGPLCSACPNPDCTTPIAPGLFGDCPNGVPLSCPNVLCRSKDLRTCNGVLTFPPCLVEPTCIKTITKCNPAPNCASPWGGTACPQADIDNQINILNDAYEVVKHAKEVIWALIDGKDGDVDKRESLCDKINDDIRTDLEDVKCFACNFGICILKNKIDIINRKLTKARSEFDKCYTSPDKIIETGSGKLLTTCENVLFSSIASYETKMSKIENGRELAICTDFLNFFCCF
ncbi:MAG: hypothetical protein ABIF89_01735 [bacterium]